MMNIQELREIPPELLAQLQQVPPTTDGYMDYRPCLVVMDDSSILTRVYVVEANSYKIVWGVWPWDDRAKSWVSIERVRQIRNSPQRIAPEFANTLYKAGESGMGYVLFTVVLKDGRRLPFVTGNAVDFPAWPEGVSADMVADVIPHEGREYFHHRPPNPTEQSAAYFWCLYRGKT
ncbi:MAG: hypothetical protein PHU85_14440 [Phycisphaerae bacterium]|nr:hypothetical protein [Phycisphaerae bacterium]